MPTESLKIKGQFFNLKTELLSSSSKGYKPKSSQVSRINGKPILVDDESNLKEICKIIKKNVAVLELNFNSFNLITSKSLTVNRLDPSKIHSKRLPYDNLIASLKLNPVIAISKSDQEITLEILEQYLNQTKLNLSGITDVDFFVLTGEMVWSTWLGNNMIANLLSQLSPNNTFWQLDHFGVWESLISQPLKTGINSSINQQALAPNLYYHKGGKKEKTINLI